MHLEVSGYMAKHGLECLVIFLINPKTNENARKQNNIAKFLVIEIRNPNNFTIIPEMLHFSTFFEVSVVICVNLLHP